MEINPFILALSKTLPESCLQGLAVYLLLQLYFFIGKRSAPLLKFNLYYLVNLCLFAGFILTFFHHYKQIQIASFTPDFLPNKTGNPISVIIAKPNLWLQFNFWINHYAYLITGFYLLGLLFCILKLAIGLINISWFRNNRNLKLDDYLTQVSIQLSSNFRLIKTVSVYLSDKISIPLTLGFIKPIIVFPIALINQLSAEQTEAILLHELAHIKRNDYLLNILLCIAQSFLFFNPAIWLMKREINKYREHCCDDLVIDNTSHKIAYAHALLLIEQNRSETLNLTLASNGKKHTLLNRIKRITNMKTNESLPQNKLVVLLLALITIGLTVAWNLPVKKAVKHFTIDKFKVIKEASDTNKIEQFTNVYHKTYTPSKKIKLQNNKKSIQFFDNITTDTAIKSKNKFKIVLEDSAGNKKEYNSIDELPVDARRDFLKKNRQASYVERWDNFQMRNDSSEIAFNSPEWKKQMENIRIEGEDIRKHYNSPEWKKKMADIRKQGIEIRKHFNSPEWKKEMADITKQGEAIRKHFNSPEWKKQMADLKKQDEKIRKQGEEIRKHFNSPEWKQQFEESTRKLVDSTRSNWKKSSDNQQIFAMPEKQN